MRPATELQVLQRTIALPRVDDCLQVGGRLLLTRLAPDQHDKPSRKPGECAHSGDRQSLFAGSPAHDLLWRVRRTAAARPHCRRGRGVTRADHVMSALPSCVLLCWRRGRETTRRTLRFPKNSGGGQPRTVPPHLLSQPVDCSGLSIIFEKDVGGEQRPAQSGRPNWAFGKCLIEAHSPMMSASPSIQRATPSTPVEWQALPPHARRS